MEGGGITRDQLHIQNQVSNIQLLNAFSITNEITEIIRKFTPTEKWPVSCTLQIIQVNAKCRVNNKTTPQILLTSKIILEK